MTLTKEEIQNSTKNKLREYAKERQIKGCTRKSKDELITLLIEYIEAHGGDYVPEVETINPAVKWYQEVSAMRDSEQIKAACEKLLETLSTEGLLPKSKNNKLRSYHKPFKEIKPTSETEHLFYEYTSPNHSKPITRHIIFKYLGLDDIDWIAENEKAGKRSQQRRNEKTSKFDIVDVINAENNEFSTEKHLSTIKLLLNSKDVWEMGVGLIAASGRRPIEIFVTGDFEICDTYPNYIQHPEYGIKFTGQAKKRDKDPELYISLLVPSNEFLEVFKRFRQSSEIKELSQTISKLKELKYSTEEINKKVENIFGKQLRNTTDLYFDFLPNYEDNNRKNILLRATYSKLIALRDYPNANSKGQLIYAGYMTGHLIPIDKDGKITHNKKDEKNLANTLHYSDYEPDTKDIPFLINVIDLEVKETKVTEEMMKIKELETYVEQLEKLLAEKDVEIKVLKEKLEYKKTELPDVEVMDNKMLFKTRKSGAAEEKLNRVWQAITAYNDSTPEYKIAPTNQILRQLTGVNGNNVSKWIKEHQIMVDDHCNKHEFKPYYNNRYRNKTDMNAEKILEVIERDYLKVYE